MKTIAQLPTNIKLTLVKADEDVLTFEYDGKNYEAVNDEVRDWWTDDGIPNDFRFYKMAGDRIYLMDSKYVLHRVLDNNLPMLCSEAVGTKLVVDRVDSSNNHIFLVDEDGREYEVRDVR